MAPRTRRSGANERLRIIVLGYLVRGPLGGMAWHHLQYVMGLRDLGHDVYFIEDSDDYPSCYDPSKGYTDRDPTYGLEFAAQTFARVGLATKWAYYDAQTARWHGPSAEWIASLGANADLLLNISAVNPIRPWFSEIPTRVAIDTDPVFTQIKNLSDPAARHLAAQHTSYFTFGENIGVPHNTMPADGFCWLPTRQPIVLEAWPKSPGPAQGKFTTVMQWDSYPAREYDGCRYGMKSDSFREFLNIPRMCDASFEIAVGGAAAYQQLSSSGWTVRDPLEVTRDPWTYQGFIEASKAEFSVAKHGYVVSRSGWFSERSAAYLASGRPVVTQETGFSDWLSSGAGVVGFGSPEEALAAIAEINARYEFHCRAARDIAHEYFDARKVLSRLIKLATEGSAEKALNALDADSAAKQNNHGRSD